MPISLSSITNNTASVRVNISGSEINVTYMPAKITEKTFAQLQKFSEMDESTIFENFKNLNTILSNIVKSWDLYVDDEQTQMYPITTEGLADLPIIVRTCVIQAIINDIRPEALAPQTQN